MNNSLEFNKPFLFMPDMTSDWEKKLRIPSENENIFHRIIRNPHINSDNPKERECTEMLASVLINAPSLCLSFFN